ncbi:MAG TPA: hypothetical protein VGB18_01950 [Candidatus Thermoplasmatota archaeon]
MRATWLGAVTVFVVLFVPVAAADAPTLKVTVDSEVPSIQIEPGERETVDLTVLVEFIDYPCPAGTEVGVDLVPPVAPPDWFGADPHPDSNTYAHPKQERAATLTIVVDEDAPGDADGAYRLKPIVHMPAPQTCGGVEPEIVAPEFSIRVLTPPAPTSPKVEATSGDPGGGNDVPGPSAWSLILLGLSVWLFRNRRK